MYSSRNEITPLLFFQGLPLWYSIRISRSSVSTAILCLLIHISSHIFLSFTGIVEVTERTPTLMDLINMVGVLPPAYKVT